ncbi:MAG: hypothetical protein M1147_07415 [Nitrospirae bacterium]|nr:hypothetical protein [Nitrospirota bacterium]MCL5977940.1 hypothetical protein [Nitrospirota bacterium]
MKGKRFAVISLIIFSLVFLGNVQIANWLNSSAYAESSVEKKGIKKKEKIRTVKWLDIGVRFDKNRQKSNAMCCSQERKIILPMIKQQYPDTDMYVIGEKNIYMTTFDLNGDGFKEILALIESWDCGSAGCPLKVYLSEGSGKYKDIQKDEDVKGWAIGVTKSKDKKHPFYDIVLGDPRPGWIYNPDDLEYKYCNLNTLAYDIATKEYINRGREKYLCPATPFDF